MNMVQCSKVVTGYRYDIGLLKGCNQFVKKIIGISFISLNNKNRFFSNCCFLNLQPFCTEVAICPSTAEGLVR